MHSQGPVRVIRSACLYWEGSLHTGVQSMWYGVPVCTEKEAYTQVYSQGPVRVIWSACLYWEGSLTGAVKADHAIKCTGFQARVQTMSAWLTTPATCWTHWRASQSRHTEPAQTSWLCSWAPPLWAILFWLMLILSVAEKTDIVEVDHLKMCALASWSDDLHDWFMLIPKSLTVISRPPQN